MLKQYSVGLGHALIPLPSTGRLFSNLKEKQFKTNLHSQIFYQINIYPYILHVVQYLF